MSCRYVVFIQKYAINCYNKEFALKIANNCTPLKVQAENHQICCNIIPMKTTIPKHVETTKTPTKENIAKNFTSSQHTKY